MKLSELQIGTEYAVIPSWTYTSRNARDINTVRENDVVKATLLSKDKYDYEPSMRKGDSNSFRKAQEGNRSIGVMVKAQDSNGGDVYWTTRLADIIAPYSVLEPKWAQQKTDNELKEAEERARRKRAEEIAEKARNQVKIARNSITTSSKELLGDKCSVEVDTEGYGENMVAVVKMSLPEYERLMELAYEGKASVA